MKKNVKFSNKLKVKYFKKNDKPSDIHLDSTSNSFDKKPPTKPKKPLKFILILTLISFFILYYFWF